MKKYLYLVLLLGLLVLLSACGGEGEEAVQEQNTPETQQPEETEPEVEEETVPAGDTANGKTIFENNCLACHGTEGAGGHNGPNLQTSAIADDIEQVIKRVKEGGASMPAFEGMMSEDEINDVAAYITEEVAPKAD